MKLLYDTNYVATRNMGRVKHPMYSWRNSQQLYIPFGLYAHLLSCVYYVKQCIYAQTYSLLHHYMFINPSMLRPIGHNYVSPKYSLWVKYESD